MSGELLFANIFFVAATVAIIIIGSGTVVMLYYVIHILRHVRAVAEKVHHASDEVGQGIETLRSGVQLGTAHLQSLAASLLGALTSYLVTKVQRRTRREKK